MDDPKANKTEEQAQQEPMPGSENKGQESTDTQTAVPTESGETAETQVGDSEELELPEKGVTERTREQFDKLKTQLREYRERLFNEQRFREPEKPEEVEPLYDKTTGLVNVKALEDIQRRTIEAEKRTKRVEERFQQTTVNSQVREMHSAYPELKNPKTDEAKEFFNESERIWMHSQAFPDKYGGETLTQKQAADLAKRKLSGTPGEAQTAQKEEAALGASGKPTQGVQGRGTEDERQRLSLGTRTGDKDSMIARMRAIREAAQAQK